MRRQVGLLSLVFLVFLILPSLIFADPGDEPEPKIDESVGELHFTYRVRFGATVDVDDIPLSRESSLWVGKPGTWASWYYATMDQLSLIKDAKIDSYKGGKRIVLPLEEPGGGPFKATQTILLLPDNVYQTRLEFTYASSEPAWFEWFPLAFRPTAFAGTHYAVGDQRVMSILPTEKWPADPGRMRLAKGWNRIRFESRMGHVEIEASPKDPDTSLEFRRARWAVGGLRSFWVGVRKDQLESGKKYEFEFTVRFPKNVGVQKGQPTSASSSVTVDEADNALVPHWGHDYIIPTPKDLTYTEDTLPLSSSTKIYVGEKPGEGVERAVHYLVNDFETDYHLRPQVIRKKISDPPPGSILIGESPRFTTPSDMLSSNGIVIPDQPQGYALSVDGKNAYVASTTGQGIFNGVMTLLQLVKVSGKGIYLQGARVMDYPALSFRGVHALTGKNAGDQIARALHVLLARNKINKFVWECEYLVWKSHPEIAHPQYGMSKRDAKKVVDAAKQLGIEIIPLVQSLGHCEWMFVGRHHLDLAEDPAFPYAYDVSNPATYTFIFSIFQEALDFFHPKTFHIGHDEVTMRGRFPFRTKGKTVTDILVQDTRKLHDWLKKRGVATMLWGDQFLYRTEGSDACLAPSLDESKARRDGLPRDVTIADWHYAPVTSDQFKSLKVFYGDGIQTVGAGWYNPVNIRNLAKACVDYDANGYLQTTWAGFNFAIDGNEDNWFQYWAYITAAEYAWTGDNQPLSSKPWNPQDVFLDLWFGRKPALKNKAGFLVDLRPLCNRSLVDTFEKPGWVSTGPDFDYSAFPMGENRFVNTLFEVRNNTDGNAAVMMNGIMNPPGKWPSTVDIQLPESRASHLCFLMTAAFRAADGRHAGDINIEYTDGTNDTLKLVYGENLFAYNDFRMSRTTWLAWKGTDKVGDRIGAWNVVWTNPTPKKTIKAIRIQSLWTEAAPILLGITGLN